MDTPNPLKDSDHLLDDLESIRKLLGDDELQPPLLTASLKICTSALDMTEACVRRRGSAGARVVDFGVDVSSRGRAVFVRVWRNT